MNNYMWMFLIILYCFIGYIYGLSANLESKVLQPTFHHCPDGWESYTETRWDSVHYRCRRIKYE